MALIAHIETAVKGVLGSPLASGGFSPEADSHYVVWTRKRARSGLTKIGDIRTVETILRKGRVRAGQELGKEVTTDCTGYRPTS